MTGAEILGVVFVVAGLFLGALIVLYLVKVLLALLQGYLDRDPEPEEDPDPLPENIPNPEVKSPDAPPF